MSFKEKENRYFKYLIYHILYDIVILFIKNNIIIMDNNFRNNNKYTTIFQNIIRLCK